MKLRQTENIAVLALFLGGIGILAGAMLAWVNTLTAAPIQRAEEKNRLQMLQKLRLPQFDRVGAESITVPDGNGGNITFLTVFRDGRAVGYAGTAANHRGYAGSITVMAGLDARGNVTAVQILKHRETPGLGETVCARTFRRSLANLTEAAPAVPANAFLDQFEGKKAGGGNIWKIRKDGGHFAYRTGATVTSRAVTAQVGDIARCWQEYFGSRVQGDRTR